MKLSKWFNEYSNIAVLINQTPYFINPNFKRH